MIAVKNLGNLKELLVQEELTQVKTRHFFDMVADKKIAALFKQINDDSIKHHGEIIKYIESHL